MARRSMATRRPRRRVINEEEVSRLLTRAQIFVGYMFVCFVDRPVSRDEIDEMGPRELRMLALKYRDQAPAPMARLAFGALDDLERAAS